MGLNTLIGASVGTSDAVAGVDGDDAAGQIAIVATAESGVLHHAAQGFLRRVFADRLGQILVTVGVTREKLSQARQDLEAVQVVEFTKGFIADFRKLKHQATTADFQHAAHLCQRLLLVGHIAQTKRNGDEIKTLIRERQGLGVDLRVLQATYKTAIRQAITTNAQHFTIDVAQYHRTAVANAILQQGGDVTRATRQIKHTITAFHTTGADEIALPEPMDAKAHEVIHQVVIARDRAENLTDQLLLLGDRNITKAEMCGVFGVLGSAVFGGVHGHDYPTFRTPRTHTILGGVLVIGARPESPRTSMGTVVAVVFVLVYLGMAVGRVPGLRVGRTAMALSGAALLLLIGALPQGLAASVDWPTLTLLFALMLIGAHFAESGAFAAVAAWLSRLRISSTMLLALVVGVTGLLSALLVNDIVVYALVPLLVVGVQSRGLDSRPYLLATAMASNAGSAASLIGNPQNLLIGELGGLDFLGYLQIAAVPSMLALVVTFLVIRWLWASALRPVTDAQDVWPGIAAPSVHRCLVWKSVLALLAVLMAMLALDGQRDLAALAIACLLLWGRRLRLEDLLRRIDWGLLLLISSLFVVTAAFGTQPLAREGMHHLASGGWSPDRLSQLVPLSLLGSNTIGNVPLVVLLVEMWSGMSDQTLSMLAVFSTLAGNFLLIGSLANLIVAERAAELQIRLGFIDFARVGVPITVVSTALAMGWFLGMGYVW